MFEFLTLLLLGFSTAAVGADAQRANPATKPQPTAAPKRVETRTASHRPADDFVQEIESLLKTARRQLPWEEFQSTHTKIATLVSEFARLYPHDPRVAKLLPERWTSLSYLRRRDEAKAEIRDVLQTTRDPALRKEALFSQTVFEIQGPIDDSVAIARAEAFAQQWPEDNRSAELLYEAVNRPGGTFWTPLALVLSLLVLAAVCTIAGLKWPAGWSRRRLVVIFLLGLLSLEIVATALYKFQRLPDPRQLEAIARIYLHVAAENLQRILWTPRAAIVVALAATAALCVRCPPQALGRTSDAVDVGCATVGDRFFDGLGRVPGPRCGPRHSAESPHPGSHRPRLPEFIPRAASCGSKPPERSHRRAVRARVCRCDHRHPHLATKAPRKSGRRRFLGNLVRPLRRRDARNETPVRQISPTGGRVHRSEPGPA